VEPGDGVVRIGLLLPLTGPQAALGAAMLEAAQLAVFELADERFMLIVRDTGETRESAIVATESALAAGARLIIGPLRGVTTREIAPTALAAGVNVMSFSNDAAVATEGVYLIGASPVEQVVRVVTYAAERGLKRFAAIVPDDAYGALVSRTLRDIAAASGVTVVAVEATDASAGELSQIMRRFTRYDERLAEAERQAAAEALAAQRSSGNAAARPDPARDAPPPEATPPPFDALLIAAGLERSREIATYLTYYEAGPPAVRLLGTSLWAGGSPRTERSLRGGWFAAPPPEVRERFEVRYRQAFKHAPARLAALAYDATALAAVLARSTEGAPAYGAAGFEMRDGFIGAEGLFRFRGDGIAERALAVFEITSAGPAVVSEPPQRFEASN